MKQSGWYWRVFCKRNQPKRFIELVTLRRQNLTFGGQLWDNYPPETGIVAEAPDLTARDTLTSNNELVTAIHSGA